MYELKKMKRYLRVYLLGPGLRLMKKKKNLPGRGLTKVDKHCSSRRHVPEDLATYIFQVEAESDESAVMHV